MTNFYLCNGVWYGVCVDPSSLYTRNMELLYKQPPHNNIPSRKLGLKIGP
jgi:hypothetical protein